MIGSSVKWEGQWNGLLGKWASEQDYLLRPGRIPGLQLWYSASNPAYDAFTYEQALPTLFDSSGNGWDAAQGTSASQARFLPHAGSNYLRLPKISGNYCATPDSSQLSITGAIDLRIKVALTAWSGAGVQTLIAKFLSTGNQRSFQFQVLISGQLRFRFSTDGTTGGNVTADSSVSVSLTPGQIEWLRVTYNPTASEAIFYTSSDGTNWTQLGTVRPASGAIFDGTASVEVGSSNLGTADLAGGAIYQAQIYNGINGTLVGSFNADLGNFNSASIGASTGETWTLGRTGLDGAMFVSSRAILPLTDDYYAMAAGAAAVLNNVSGGTMLAARMCNAVSANMRMAAFSTDTATNERMVMGLTTTSFSVLGRRLDADSLQTNSAATQQLAYEFAIEGGRLDYAQALSANFKNGALVGTEDAFQTAGSSSNTDSARTRVFSNLADTPASFQSGPVTDLIIYNRALTNVEIAQLSRYLASRTGGALSI